MLQKTLLAAVSYYLLLAADSVLANPDPGNATNFHLDEHSRPNIEQLRLNDAGSEYHFDCYLPIVGVFASA